MYLFVLTSKNMNGFSVCIVNLSITYLKKSLHTFVKYTSNADVGENGVLNHS